jgi:hypothetical protein
MIIPIDEKYRLTTDQYNVILQRGRKNKKTGEIEYQNFKYYASFQDALKAMVRIEILSLDDVKKFEKKVDELNRKIDKLKFPKK